MPKSLLIEVNEEKPGLALKVFLKNLLENGRLDALLLPLRLPSGNASAPALVTAPEMMDDADPLSPVMTVSTARLVSSLTKVAASGKKIGVLLRPCELRALIELIKLKQASRENLILIGMDCYGTGPVSSRDAYSNSDEFLERVKSGEEALLREACRVCEYPAPLNADIVIGLIGLDTIKSVLIRAQSDAGEALLDGLGTAESMENIEKGREKAVADLIAARTENKQKLYARFEGETIGPENLMKVFADCVNCHNCRVACPLCYCRECFFDSATFDLEAEKYLNRAAKRGAMRLPGDSLLYHLTRLTHMASSCVGCGLCQEACPNDVPVFPVFRIVGEQVQKTFQYVAGRSPDEELPLSTFREEELGEVGER
jgi:formate dehydrogenase subunit beta